MEFSLDSLQPKERASFALRVLYEAAGCRKYHMGRFEEYGLYQENRSFLSSEQVITFTDLDGRLLALKPDVTLSIAKTAQPAPGETLRYYYHENVYRPSAESHTFQEISQMGLEMLGAVGEAQVQQAVRLAAQSLARGSGMAETLRGLCITALGFGTAAMLAQSVLAGPCARYLLHDVRAETALLILAPSLPFMAVSGAVRGCFLAARRVQPNITAQLIEQLVRMAVAAAGLRVLAQWGAGYGCAAVLLGNTVSESVSCGIMLAFAARTPEFAPRPGAPLHPYTRKELYDILWPVEGSRLLASALQAAESSLIPYTLAIYTGSRAEAVAQYGSLKGMALPLLFFPFSVLGALSGLLMPEITRAHTKGDTAAMRRLIFTMLRMTGAFSLAAGVGFVLLGAPLAGFIYRDAKVGRYVQLLGFVAPFMYLESMVDGVLKGLGEQLATFRYSLFDSVFRIAAIWLVVPQYGMMGFLGVMAVSNLMTCGLNMRRMMEQIKKPSP